MGQLRKATKSEQIQLKEEAVRVIIPSRATGVGLPKPFGIHALRQTGPRAGRGAVELNVCPEFCSCFRPFPFYPISTFWDGNVYLVPQHVGIFKFLFIFTGVYSYWEPGQEPQVSLLRVQQEDKI